MSRPVTAVVVISVLVFYFPFGCSLPDARTSTRAQVQEVQPDALCPANQLILEEPVFA